jgi:hypothetical protein
VDLFYARYGYDQAIGLKFICVMQIQNNTDHQRDDNGALCYLGRTYEQGALKSDGFILCKIW